MKKLIFLFVLLTAVAIKLYTVYDPGLVSEMPFLKAPYLDVLLLLTMIIVLGRQMNGYVLFAFISNFMGGITINNGTTQDEKTMFFFIGMAFYFSLHVNLILYFIKINTDWLKQLKQFPIRILLPVIWWLVAYSLLVPMIPAIGIIPVFIYSGIYVLVISFAWNLGKVIVSRGLYLQLLVGVIFFTLSDTILGFVIFGQVAGQTFQYLNLQLALSTWTIGVFLVFYSLIFIQKELPQPV